MFENVFLLALNTQKLPDVFPKQGGGRGTGRGREGGEGGGGEGGVRNSPNQKNCRNF